MDQQSPGSGNSKTTLEVVQKYDIGKVSDRSQQPPPDNVSSPKCLASLNLDTSLFHQLLRLLQNRPQTLKIRQDSRNMIILFTTILGSACMSYWTAVLSKWIAFTDTLSVPGAVTYILDCKCLLFCLSIVCLDYKTPRYLLEDGISLSMFVKS